VFFRAASIARTIFHPDDELLNYLKDDGSNIEPEFYVPVIPMVLNGADGIGTGWSIREQLRHGRSLRPDGRLLEKTL
jgi:DNA topoisomerase-2